MLFVLLAGMFFLGCQKDDNNNNTTSVTAHSCGATNVHNPNLTYGTLKDIDGNSYKTIQIGTQTWMAENLKTTKYRNSVSIPIITDNYQWGTNKTGACCSIENNPEKDCPYGKLYNWYAANNSNQICPDGWHVPTNTDWRTLISYIDPLFIPNPEPMTSSSIAGVKLKSIGTSYWLNAGAPASEIGTNTTGFSGLPAGDRQGVGTSFVGYLGTWWSGTVYRTNSDSSLWVCSLANYSKEINLGSGKFSQIGYSIRCIKD